MAVVDRDDLASGGAKVTESAGWRTRRPGVFEGLPRTGYRLAGDRYIQLCAAGALGHAVAVAGFGLLLVTLYVDLAPAEVGLYTVTLLGAQLLEGLVAAGHVWRMAGPVRSWIADPESDDVAAEAWAAAARLPTALLRRPDLYLLGAAGAVASCLVLTHLLQLPTTDLIQVLPLACVLYLSSVVLRYLGYELGMRPVLEAAGRRLPVPALQPTSMSLHRRLVAAIPTVTWGSGVIVGGLLTDDTRGLERLGAASLVALGVAAGISVWLSLVLADAVSGPVVDLRDATRQVATGDLSVRVPVMSTDETGQLGVSFNAMVAGLDERERLRDALAVLVDPDLAERVLAEGTDLAGEEVTASVLFLDVRGFTAFAETAAPHDVVAALNTLYDVVVPVILRHGGHANRFLGDGLLAVFGAPERQPDHARQAVEAAQEITQLLARAPDGGGLRVGIGIHTGRVVVGTIGGGGRRDFTVIGDTVNTAARVEGATRETGDDLLITQATLSALGKDLQQTYEERPSVPLKGKAEVVRLYAPRASTA